MNLARQENIKIKMKVSQILLLRHMIKIKVQISNHHFSSLF